MFSIILYGRNDSHGYNLHKRAAISLNSMAEMMTSPTDEIIFVDYNTPDDLPTFIEAIQDTLTEKARRLTRVLRVRERQHRQFAASSHLVALEPIARNVAIRRSNPENRWILSTNTDMIFVPVNPKHTLSDVIGEQPDGYYHLPRFELPECLWEAFDRKDGAGIIEHTRNWGRRFHLNEVVYSSSDNLYDAPGDFQLGLRQDYFDIHGFHEEMLRGWHVDANIAKRMRIKRGKVSTLADRLLGYHCDHTRQATAVHKRDRVENDTTRFVDNVKTPGVAAQAENWGLKDDEVEEIRLSNGVSARYVRALEKAIGAPSKAAPYEAWYTAESYNRLAYPAEHVLPYLTDLLSCAPRGSRVGYAGVRTVMFSLVKSALEELDPTAVIGTPQAADWLGAGAPLAEWMENNDIFVFEIGEDPDGDLDDAERDSQRMSTVLDVFRRFTDMEERRQVEEGRQPRRVIAVNAIHTYFEVLVSDSIAHTTTPYSSRTRHGFVAPDRLPAAPKKTSLDVGQVGERLAHILKRATPAPGSEVRRLVEIAESLPLTAKVSSPEWIVALQVAEPLIALMRDTRTAPALGRNSAELDALAQLLEQNRGSARPPAELEAFPLRDGPSDAGTRLADVDDWERPSFLYWARHYFSGRKEFDFFTRRPWVWERCAVLEEIGRSFDFASLLGGERPRILVVSSSSEYTAACLIDAGADVDFVDPHYFLGEPGRVTDWRGSLNGGLLKLPRPIGSMIDTLERGGLKPYDAIVSSGNTLFAPGVNGTVELLGALLPWLRPGGVLVTTGIVQLLGESQAGRVSRELTLRGRLAEGMEVYAALSPLRGVDYGLSRRTADRSTRSGQSSDGIEAFLWGEDETLINGLWSWRKGRETRFDAAGLRSFLTEREETTVLDIQPYQRWNQRRSPAAAASADSAASTFATAQPIATPRTTLTPIADGSQFSRLRAEPFTIATPRAIRVTASSPVGRFASAGLGIAASGVYETVFELKVGNVRDPAKPAVTVQVFSGSALVIESTLSAGDIQSKARRAIEFQIASASGQGAAKTLEISFSHHGVADIDLSGLSIYSGLRV